MTITELLKSEDGFNLRLSCGTYWMVYNPDRMLGAWIIYAATNGTFPRIESEYIEADEAKAIEHFIRLLRDRK